MARKWRYLAGKMAGKIDNNRVESPMGLGQQIETEIVKVTQSNVKRLISIFETKCLSPPPHSEGRTTKSSEGPPPKGSSKAPGLKGLGLGVPVGSGGRRGTTLTPVLLPSAYPYTSARIPGRSKS